MSSLSADVVIWALLTLGIVYSGFSLTGLLLFPDTKSRMFTAFRAAAISLGAVSLAVIIYGGTLFMAGGGGQYLELLLRTLVLVSVLATGLFVMYRSIRKRSR